jgi:hypothetical protein
MQISRGDHVTRHSLGCRTSDSPSWLEMMAPAACVDLVHTANETGPLARVCTPPLSPIVWHLWRGSWMISWLNVKLYLDMFEAEADI